MPRLGVPSDTEELVVMLVGEITMGDYNKAIGGTLFFFSGYTENSG